MRAICEIKDDRIRLTVEWQRGKQEKARLALHSLVQSIADAVGGRTTTTSGVYPRRALEGFWAEITVQCLPGDAHEVRESVAQAFRNFTVPS